MDRQRYRYRDVSIEPDSHTISLVGVAELGSRVAELLAREGFSLRLIDSRSVEYHCLYGATLFTTDDVGVSLAEAAKRHIREINPGCVVKAFDEGLRENTAYLLQGDLLLSTVVDKTMNHVVRERAIDAGSPWAALNLSEDGLRVDTKPRLAERHGMHDGGYRPSRAAVAAGRVVDRVDAWLEEGVRSRVIRLLED